MEYFPYFEKKMHKIPLFHIEIDGVYKNLKSGFTNRIWTDLYCL